MIYEEPTFVLNKKENWIRVNITRKNSREITEWFKDRGYVVEDAIYIYDTYRNISENENLS